MVLYKNARIIDPHTCMDKNNAFLITKDGFIDDFGPMNDLGEFDATRFSDCVDCSGYLLMPGVIDMHVHFRDPGHTYKEDLVSGSKAAASGGVTTVVCQPNTNPVIDNVYILGYLRDKIRQHSYINIHYYSAISHGLAGELLVEMHSMLDAGVLGFTDDGKPVMNSMLMYRALECGASLGTIVAQHAEDINLSQNGCINCGNIAAELSVVGISGISEAIIVNRDLLLCENIPEVKYHVLHVSAHQSLEAIMRAREKQINVTCEITPHPHVLCVDTST